MNILLPEININIFVSLSILANFLKRKKKVIALVTILDKIVIENIPKINR